MGGTKGLVMLRSRPLLHHVLDAVAHSRVCDPIVVVGADADRVIPLVEEAGARWVWNEAWRHGQTSSLLLGIGALDARAGAFLIHPVDHALVTDRDLDALVRAWEGAPEPDRAILRPAAGGRLGHPVLFGRSFREEFLALKADEPGHVVYRRHLDRVVLVPVDNPLVAVDLDTPEDLARHGA